MNEKIYAKAQRSFDHDNVRRSKKSLAFAVEKSLYTQFEATHLVRAATEEEIAEAKAAEVKASAPTSETTVPDPVKPVVDPNGGGDGDGDNPPPLTAEQFIDGTVPDVVARIEGATKELIEGALAAETAKGEKARKGVTDALTAALTPAAQ